MSIARLLARRVSARGAGRQARGRHRPHDAASLRGLPHCMNANEPSFVEVSLRTMYPRTCAVPDVWTAETTTFVAECGIRYVFQTSLICVTWPDFNVTVGGVAGPMGFPVTPSVKRRVSVTGFASRLPALS